MEYRFSVRANMLRTYYRNGAVYWMRDYWTATESRINQLFTLSNSYTNSEPGGETITNTFTSGKTSGWELSIGGESSKYRVINSETSSFVSSTTFAAGAISV